MKKISKKGKKLIGGLCKELGYKPEVVHAINIDYDRGILAAWVMYKEEGKERRVWFGEEPAEPVQYCSDYGSD